MNFLKNMFNRSKPDKAEVETQGDVMEKNKEIAKALLPEIQEILSRVNEEQGKNFVCKGFENNREYSFAIQDINDEAGVILLQLDINLDNDGQELHSHYLYSNDLYFPASNVTSFLHQGIEERLLNHK